MKIKKHSGEIVNFDKFKLIKSLIFSGATQTQANIVVREIQKDLYDGISTKKIYRLAYQKLKNISKPNAARYSLKSGIIALGPAGFYFEKFIARLFEIQKYKVTTNVILKGNCISHELDVLVEKNNITSMIECKFHSNQEVKTDVKIPMYILSRFNDLKKKEHFIFNESKTISKCWLVTNNRFTSEAIKFAECSGLFLLSWDYPIGKGIKDLSNELKVYPVTCLTTLTLAEKEILLLQDFLTVYDLVKQKNVFDKLKLSAFRLKSVMNECNQLLNI